jgi:hypothetical protein
MPGNDCTGPSRSASERFGASEALAGRSTVSGSLPRSWQLCSPRGDGKIDRGEGAISISGLLRCQPLAGWPASG